MKKLLVVLLALALLCASAVAETVSLNDYLETLYLKVYTNDQFSQMTGTTVFSQTPKITICSYIPMDATNSIVWHDGEEGYICMDLEKLLLASDSSMGAVFADVCENYRFDLYMTVVDGQRVVYAPRKQSIAKYTRQTGIEPDVVCHTKDDFIAMIPEE